MKPTRVTAILIVSAFLVSSLAPGFVFSQGTSGTLDGFTTDGSRNQRRLEETFRAVPSPSSAREHLRRLTAAPHVAGTKEDYDTAIYVRDQIRSYGITAELKEYDVLLPYPKHPGIVELITTRRERLALREAIVPQDPSSSHPKIIPLFNGYSPSGDVTAPLVYVNYGLPPDYEALKKLGVDVKGKIAIVRYGNSFRGVKAKVAEDQGAVGLIIYSDPADDGYSQGDVYPKGPWRPASSAQRGSVQYIFEAPGDPLTPGKPSVPGVPRLKMEEITGLPKIPVQPISYGDARTSAGAVAWSCSARRFPGRPSVFLSRRWDTTREGPSKNSDGLSGAKNLECDGAHRRH